MEMYTLLQLVKFSTNLAVNENKVNFKESPWIGSPNSQVQPAVESLAIHKSSRTRSSAVSLPLVRSDPAWSTAVISQCSCCGLPPLPPSFALSLADGAGRTGVGEREMDAAAASPHGEGDGGQTPLLLLVMESGNPPCKRREEVMQDSKERERIRKSEEPEKKAPSNPTGSVNRRGSAPNFSEEGPNKIGDFSQAVCAS